NDDLSRITARRLCGGCESPLRRTSHLGITGAIPQCMEPRGQIIQALCDHMNYALLALQFAGAVQECGTERCAAEAFEDGGPDNQIGDPSLVLDRNSRARDNRSVGQAPSAWPHTENLLGTTHPCQPPHHNPRGNTNP